MMRCERQRRLATKLEAALIARAIAGTERYKFHANGTVEVWTEHDNRFGLDVLRWLLPEGHRAGGRPAQSVMSRDEFLAIVTRHETNDDGRTDDTD